MLRDALFALVHHLAIFALIATLVAELILCKGALDANGVRRLVMLDRAYFIAAILAITTGLLRLFLGTKGWPFYVANPFFWAKMATFLVIALLSVPPTIAFLRWRKTGVTPYPDETNRVRRYISWQTMLLPLLPLFAVLMARGIGAA
jgi:putative membrane protein